MYPSPLRGSARPSAWPSAFPEASFPFTGFTPPTSAGPGKPPSPWRRCWAFPWKPPPLLREIDVGALAGLSREEAEARSPEFIRAAQRDPWHTPRPGGESMADLARRLEAFLETLPAGRHLLVTHGGVIRAALKMALDLEGDAWRRFHIPNTSITRILLPEREVLAVSDSAHLETWADWLSDESVK